MLAESPEDKMAFVRTALTALLAVKNKKNRPHELELASALIVGDALRTLKTLKGSEAYKGFLEKHKITPTHALTFTRLAETIEGVDLRGCTLQAVIKKLAELKHMGAKDALPFAQQLIGDPASPPHRSTSSSSEWTGRANARFSPPRQTFRCDPPSELEFSASGSIVSGMLSDPQPIHHLHPGADHDVSSVRRGWAAVCCLQTFLSQSVAVMSWHALW